MTAGNAEEFDRIADQLCEVTEAFRAVDYNLLLDEQVVRVIEMKGEVQEMCLQYRQDQHASVEEGRRGR